MGKQRLIVIGSSAGGVEALIALLGALPENFRTPICVAHHIPSLIPSRLPAILTRLGRLPAFHPPSGTQMREGTIFLAPPAHNLSVIGEHVVVTQALLQRPWPSVNLLFESAASSYGSGVIGILLTGMLTDGTAGLQAVKNAGGTTIIQDPQEAAYPSMPQNARNHCVIDYCLELTQIALLLHELTT